MSSLNKVTLADKMCVYPVVQQVVGLGTTTMNLILSVADYAKVSFAKIMQHYYQNQMGKETIAMLDARVEYMKNPLGSDTSTSGDNNNEMLHFMYAMYLNKDEKNSAVDSKIKEINEPFEAKINQYYSKIKEFDQYIVKVYQEQQEHLDGMVLGLKRMTPVLGKQVSLERIKNAQS